VHLARGLQVSAGVMRVVIVVAVLLAALTSSRVYLTPSDTRHGQLGLYAGARFAQSQLPSSELNRIAQQVMRPSLSGRDLGGGIGLGLETIASDVRQASATQAQTTQSGGAASGGAGSAQRTSADPALVGWLTAGLWMFLSFFGFTWIAIAAVFIFVITRIAKARRGGYGGTSGSSWWSSSSSGSSFSSGDSGSSSSGGSSGGTRF
jgi:uncharacterized membrane protein YgcG